jgi:hypothetical protein
MLKIPQDNNLKKQEKEKDTEIKLPVYDSIKSLPTNTDIINDLDLQIVNNLFGTSNKSIKENVLHEAKDLIIISILFIILSLPQTDKILQKYLPITNNYSYNIILKTIIFVIFYWVIKHFYLIRKN